MKGYLTTYLSHYMYPVIFYMCFHYYYIQEIKRLEKEQIEIDRKNAILAEKERHRLLKLKQEKERDDKIKHMKMEFYEKAEVEYNRKLESVQIIQELEQEEKELLVRLAKTQALQEKAYSILQRTLSS
jgi:hypothetical protein